MKLRISDLINAVNSINKISNTRAEISIAEYIEYPCCTNSENPSADEIIKIASIYYDYNGVLVLYVPK